MSGTSIILPVPACVYDVFLKLLHPVEATGQKKMLFGRDACEMCDMCPSFKRRFFVPTEKRYFGSEPLQNVHSNCDQTFADSRMVIIDG